MLIDSHVHVENLPQFGLPDTPEMILPLLDEAGIERAIMMTYSDAPMLGEAPIAYMAEVMAQYPRRFYAYARMHPAYGDQALKLFERAISTYGLHGLKLHPVSNLCPPVMAQTLDLIRMAAGFGLPTLFHCGDESNCTPFEIELAAQAVPTASIILAHLGGYQHCAEAIQVAKRNANVYLDSSAVPYPAWIRRAIDTVGAGKVIFGSDGPGCDPRLEVFKLRRAGLTKEEMELVGGGNILRLLGGTQEVYP